MTDDSNNDKTFEGFTGRKLLHHLYCYFYYVLEVIQIYEWYDLTITFLDPAFT